MTGASGAHVSVAGRNGHLIIEIAVTEDTSAEGITHLDLTAVSDRVDAAGGTLVVEEQPNRGCLIATSLPVLDHDEALV